MSQATKPPLPTRQYLDDCQWIEDHWTELVSTYPDQWVAVHKGRLLAGGPDLGEVSSRARSQCRATDVAYQFIDTGSLIF